jgi:Bor protein.
MLRFTRLLPLLCLCFAGCYHANVETGRAPGNQRIENGWAPGYLGGLVSPSPVDAKSSCPNGISRVETERSFLNGLVAFATLSIYTPMSISVTCAAPPSQRPISLAPDTAPALAHPVRLRGRGNP